MVFLSLPCDSSLQYFPTNTISRFRVKLPYELDFSKGQWVVALTSLQYTHMFKTVNNFRPTLKAFWTHTGLPLGEIEGFYCSDVEDCLAKLNKSLNDAMRAATRRNYELVNFALDEDTGHVRFEGHREYQNKLHLSLPCKLLDSLGITSEAHVPPHDPHTQRDYCYIKNCLGTKKAYITHRYAFNLHSNLASHSRIAGTNICSVLRCVPIEKNYSQIVNFEPKHLQYLPLQLKNVSEIEIYFTDAQNEPLYFLGGKTIIHLQIKDVSEFG